MGVVAIIGAGMMGSAMAMPLADNGHKVRLVGTHLDREIIDRVRSDNYHPTLKRYLPGGVIPDHVENISVAVEGADLIICGVSSFGVDWFCEHVIPQLPSGVPVLAVTKGLAEGQNGALDTFPHVFASYLKPGQKISFNAIGGPCTSYELADRRHSHVYFCGSDQGVLDHLRSLLTTDYYHISISTDVIGIESAVALKNAYALAVTLAVGQQERDHGEGCQLAYNPQAALFGQSVREMSLLLKMMGGAPESLIAGIADLYVTIFGGRTRLLGTLLGRGLSFAEAMERLAGVTLESVAITNRIAKAVRVRAAKGEIELSKLPLLMHIDEIINQSAEVNIPWHMFTNY
ncbi:MAG: 3-hydroxyacyl-CoA dehydrogenase NAD-binding domain-containing protein [Candidatus Wallacebacter cryptica]|nr:glycerol-3-phosphate dehydrogenase [Bacillota bacterium]